MKIKTIYLLATIILSFNSFGQQYQFHLDRNIDIYGKPVKSTLQKNLKGNVAEVFTFFCLKPQESADKLKDNLDRNTRGSHGFVVKYNKEGWKIATASLKDSMDIYKPSEWIEYEVIDNMPESFIIESIFINRHKHKFEYKKGRLKKVYELDDGVWEIETKVKCDREGRIKKYDRSGDGSPHKYFYSNDGEMLIIKEYAGGYNYYNKKGLKVKEVTKSEYDLATQSIDYTKKEEIWEYDENNNLIKHFKPKSRNSILLGGKGINDTYKYKYDEQGNWIERVSYEHGEIVSVNFRKIVYY